jgi:hypothetical protein
MFAIDLVQNVWFLFQVFLVRAMISSSRSLAHSPMLLTWLGVL